MERYFHNELEDIRNNIILMGQKAIEAAKLSTKGFLESDLELTQKAVSLDDEIDELEVQVDRDAVRYISLRSPVSSDVRLLFVAIKASHDLERAGDEAHSIAKKTRSILSRDGRVPHLAQIEEMGELAFDMMRDAITSLVEEDIELARDIIKRDKQVDKINRANFKTLSASMNGDSETNSSCVETILISKSIERIGDHAKNLAEEVIYLLTGKS